MAGDEDIFAELEAARARQSSYRAAATPEVAAAVGANRAAYSHLRPGDALALAKARQGPDSPVTKKVSAARAKRKTKKSFWGKVGGVATGAAAKVKGGVDFVIPDAVVDVAGSAIGEASQVFKPIARTGFTALSAIPEEIGTIARAGIAQTHEQGVVSALNPFSAESKRYWDQAGPSTARLAAAKALQGKEVKLGSGFLPGRGRDDPNTPENEEQVGGEQERLARRLTIDGQWISLGRVVADVVTEPGTKPYNVLSGVVDAAMAIKLDPAANLLGNVAKARKASKGFVPEEVGLITGRRKTVDVDKADEWLVSKDGLKIKEDLAADEDWFSIWTRTKRTMDPNTAMELEGAKTTDAVDAILRREILGGAIATKPDVARVPFANAAVRRVVDARIWQGMPAKAIDFDDPAGAVTAAENYLRNANIRDPKVISNVLRGVVEGTAPGAGGVDRFRAVEALADTVEMVVADRLRRTVLAGRIKDDATGVTEQLAMDRAYELTTLFRNSTKSLTGWYKDDIGNNVWFPGAKVNGENIVGASPHLIAEALNSKVYLPAARDIRQATSRFGKILAHPTVDVPLTTMDWIQQSLWKPMVLLRGAWVVRVVGEESVRMAGAGFTSFANNPMSAIAWTVSGESKVGRFATKIGGKAGVGATDLKGDAFAARDNLAPEVTAFEQGMYKGKVSNAVGRAGRVRTNDRIMYEKGHRDYDLNRANEMLVLRADPIGRRVAQGGLGEGDKVATRTGNGIDDLKEWLWSGAGKEERAKLIKKADDPETAPVTRELSDAYVDTVVDRLNRVTGGDTALMDAVATGKYTDATHDIPLRFDEVVHPDFTKRLAGMRDSGPDQIIGWRSLDVDPSTGAKAAEKLTTGVNWMFAQLMARPSNYLSRSPVFRQAYWGRVTESMHLMDDAGRQAAIAAAKEAKLSRAVIDRMESLSTTKVGTLGLDDVDALAKGHALETTRDLLYDLSNKGQFADQTRLIMPFAEAWKEVLTRWARIAAENPKVIRRGQQVVEGARGAGWFQPDPTTGEEMLVFPGSEFLTEHTLGVKIPLMGRVAGLSMAASIMPGFGPVVQLPASMIIPNKPEWDGVRKALLPFGDPDMEQGFLESFMPAWAKKWHTAFIANDPENDRLFGNAVMDMARYLVSTGDYSLDSADEVERTLTAATHKAKGLYVLRGAAQFFAPSAPSPQFLAMDKSGKFVIAQKLIEDYRELQDEDYDTATEKFIERYGEEALLFMQPKTTGGAPPTEELGDWAAENPDLAKRYSTVYGYFGPTGGEFDPDFYHRQVRGREKTPVTPRESLEFGNHRVAAFRYRQAKAQVEGRTDLAARQWLATVRDGLVESYPGYDPQPKDLGKTGRLIREIERAVKDPKMAATEAGQGIAAYLEARTMALEAANNDLQLTSGFGRAKKARYLRDYMRDVGAQITESYPAFAAVYEQVFDREMVEDATEAEEDAA